MPTIIRPDTPTTLQGAYACDLAVDSNNRVFGAWIGSDWNEEALFGSRSFHLHGHWQFAPGYDEHDFLARLGVTRFRLYAGYLNDDTLNPVQLAESPTVLQDPAVATHDTLQHVAWGEKLNGSFSIRAWNGTTTETVAHTPASLTRPTAAIDSDGQPWVAWQAFGAHGCIIMVSRRGTHGWTPPTIASTPSQSAWRPTLRATAQDGVWLTWDAWNGHHFHVFIRRISPDGTLQPPLQLSDQPLLAMDADLSIAPDGAAWVAWEQSPPWGTNHRFNETKRLTLAGINPDGSLFIPSSPWNHGQAPIPIEEFITNTSAEYIVPVAPRLLAGPNGIELYFRRFRSRDHKDFGWRLERMIYAGSDWSEPELVSPFEGMPDTRFGVAALADGSRLVAHNATEYLPTQTADRAAAGCSKLRAGSAPVTFERIELVTIDPPPPTDDPPTRLQLTRYETARPDYPQATRDGRTLTIGDQTYMLLWGDLHRHSHLSKCLSPNDGSPVENFRWSLDHNRMDWWALTEHLEYLSYNEWRRVEETVAAFTDDGRFEPMFGFEWGSNPGHTNIFYRDQQLGEELRALTLVSPSLEDLMERWDARIPQGEVLAARHYQGHRQPDVFDGYRSQWEPCMEIMQSRGEQRDWIETFLREGARIGFVGATDHARHWHFAYCMTGVWATAPTRDAIFDAIWNRRTVAASAKILLHTEVSGIPMGREGTITGDAQIRVLAESPQPLRTIDIYRNGALVHHETVDTPRLDWTWTDRGQPRSECYYYVRVAAQPALAQATPAVAYASPIWTHSPPR
jgi:hypothetical protein